MVSLSSNPLFRVQVCFTPIWHCDPLSEHEFRDAIGGNYYSAKKFNFGLSEDQVDSLFIRFIDLFWEFIASLLYLFLNYLFINI